MNEAWVNVLTASGAVFANGAVDHFGNKDAELKVLADNGGIADLSHRGLLAARGEDARSFLQGQLTCDVNSLDASHSLLGAWCSAKGQLFHTFDVIVR